MKLLQMNYRCERGQQDAKQAEHLLEAAERIAGVPGLQWKIWIYDDSQRAANGSICSTQVNTPGHRATRCSPMHLAAFQV